MTAAAIGIWATIAVAAGNADMDRRFAAANRMYEEGRYGEATAEYEAIRQYGIDDSTLHYNLGNAYFKQNDLGRALANWERARRHAPGDSDILANLRFARTLTFDRMESAEPPFPIGALLRWRTAVTANAETIVLLVLYLAAQGFLAALQLEDRRVIRRLFGYGLGLTLASCLVVTTSLAIRIHHQRNRIEVIVLDDTVEVRSGPGAGQTVLFTVHEGLKAEVRHRRDGWLQVSLPNGWNGWIPRTAAEII